MKKILTSIEALEKEGYKPFSNEDENAIKTFLELDKDLYIDESGKVWINETKNVCIANVTKIKED